MSEFMIKEATKETVNSLEAINHLISQLSSRNIVLSQKGYFELVESSSSRLFLLYSDGVLAGMLTLCSYLCPTGKKSWIEDVVVDRTFRGMGLGRKLIEYAIAETKMEGRSSLMLTSRPSRVEANRLYQSAGFEKRETNVYRMKF